MNVALIGYGAIGQHLVKALTPEESARISHLLVRPRRVAEIRGQVAEEIKIVSGAAEIGAPIPELAIEVAGQDAVAEHGAAILLRGIDLVIVSVGTLADPILYDRLRGAAAKGGAKLLIPAGAVAAIDGLAAAREGGLDWVTYTSRKPPLAWKGTPGEDICDLDALDEAVQLFEGRADDAALLYPKNANVAATVALAGAGFERTKVRLIADPEAPGNIHQIEAAGAFGRFAIELEGRPLPGNPRTSSLTAFSVLRAIRNRAGLVEI